MCKLRLSRWETLTARAGLHEGIIATYSFLAKDSPRYTLGYSLALAFVVVSMLSCTAYFFAVRYENGRRERELGGLPAGGGREGIDGGVGAVEDDFDPSFRYAT